MKITYIENVRIPSERAHAYQIMQTCAGLAACGHEVVLLTPTRTTEDAFTSFGLPRTFTHERVACWDPLSGRKRFTALAYVLQRFSFVRAMRRRAATMRSDVWYTRDAAMIDALPSVGPWVLELHDAPADLARWERVRPRVKQFIAISEGIKKWLLENGIPQAQITVAQDGFDPALFESMPPRAAAREALGLPENAFALVYSGACYPWKGVDLAVQAWGGVPQSAHLLIVGGAEADYARLRTLVPAGVQSRVQFLPSMPRTELVRLYAAADAGLLSTSPNHAIGRLYTSPLKLFEYLAAGLPVVASDVPSSHDVLTKEVARFFAHTEQAFVDAVAFMVNEGAWRSGAAHRAPEMARPYSWFARAKRISDALPAV